MSKITLIIENDKTKNVQIDSSHTVLAFITKGNYIEIEGVEYYINSIKTIVKEGRIVEIKAKLFLDSSKF